MRFKTKPIELEAVKYDGQDVPEFAEGRIVSSQPDGAIMLATDEGERSCSSGDYLILTDSGQVLVRAGAIFETVFEPAK